MKKLYLRLYGGFGNQIFQIAASLLFSKKNNIRTIYFDDDFMTKYTSSRKNEIFNFFDFKSSGYTILKRNSVYLKFRLPKIPMISYNTNFLISDHNFTKIYFSKLINNKTFFFDGYFQNCLSQENFESQIKILKPLLIKNSIEFNEGCVIHIRGGDFVKLGWDSVCSEDYYLKATQYFFKSFGIESFSVVTDDRKYAKQVLGSIGFKYTIIGGTIYEDFNLIRSFKFRILSSSTFSFWASALGDNSNSKVIAPKMWTPSSARLIRLPNEIDF